MNQPIIKNTAKDDIPALQIVLGQTELFPSELLPDMFEASSSNEGNAIWLTCHLNQQAVGFCYVEAEELAEGTWNMLALAVRPDLQGQKIGTKIVEAAEHKLRDLAQRVLIVDTSSAEEFALTRKFYVLNNYEEEARIRDFWSAGDHKVIFRKAL